VDHERVQVRLRELTRTLETLEDFDICAADLRQNRATRWQVEHGLQVAIQIMLDVGTHILASDHDVRVDDYTEVVDCLDDLDLVESETAAQLRPLPALRNILVHEYADVDYDLLVDHLSECISPLRTFARQIAELVEE